MEFPRGPGEENPQYIGDGVYVTFDGYHFWLRTPRGNVWHEIALDPGTLENLFSYIANTKTAAIGTAEEESK
jgi:hypothetical protein